MIEISETIFAFLGSNYDKKNQAMKYAYVIGSNAFIVPSRVISYSDQDKDKDFLRINSIYHDLPSGAEKTFLDINLDIKDMDGSPITVLANKIVTGTSYHIKNERGYVKVLRTDGSVVIHVHQLDADAAMSLEHNITAELEVQTPVVVIRITGDFLLGALYISAENEKLFVNDIGYATSAMTGKNQLKFTSEGVVL